MVRPDKGTGGKAAPRGPAGGGKTGFPGYVRPVAWKLGMVLLFGGLGYQLWLNVTLKRRMEEQETQ